MGVVGFFDEVGPECIPLSDDVAVGSSAVVSEIALPGAAPARLVVVALYVVVMECPVCLVSLATSDEVLALMIDVEGLCAMTFEAVP